MERVTLEIEARTPGKSSAARALRRTGQDPGHRLRQRPDARADRRRRGKLLREALTRRRRPPLDPRRQGAGRAGVACRPSSRSSRSTPSATADPLRPPRDPDGPARSTGSPRCTLVGEPRGVKMSGGVLDQPTHEICDRRPAGAAARPHRGRRQRARRRRLDPRRRPDAARGRHLHRRSPTSCIASVTGVDRARGRGARGRGARAQAPAAEAGARAAEALRRTRRE